jgi:hypothetical protein
MRFVNVCASGAIAAGLLLSACSSSSGGSQPLPSNPQAIATKAHSAHLTVVGGRQFTASCDTSLYLTCVTIAKGSPATIEICYNSEGSGCSSGSFPTLTWYEAIYSVKDKPYKKIVGSFYPNPGNPTDDTIAAKKKVKNSHGVVKYFQYIEGCLSTSDCLTGEIGIATQ